MYFLRFLHGAEMSSELPLLLETINFSAEKHRNQRRKDPDATPYINHPIGTKHTSTARVHTSHTWVCLIENLWYFHRSREDPQPWGWNHRYWSIASEWVQNVSKYKNARFVAIMYTTVVLISGFIFCDSMSKGHVAKHITGSCQHDSVISTDRSHSGICMQDTPSKSMSNPLMWFEVLCEVTRRSLACECFVTVGSFSLSFHQLGNCERNNN